MATTKFIGSSPYALKHECHDSDYLYKTYENNTNANMQSKTKSKPVFAALFGLGRAGSIHLSNMIGNPRIILKYIVDENTPKWSQLKTYWNLSEDVIFLTPNDAKRVYEDSSIDIVVVASPTHTHEEIATKALYAKKSIFCEKPISEDIATSKKLYELAKKNGKTLFSAFNRRFDPAYASLKKKVRSGEVGHVQILKVCARDSPLPSLGYLKTSGGIFHDCLVHDFDMATWVLGELPIKVQATATALIPEIKAIDDFDTVAFVLTFPSGTIAIGDNSRYSVYGYDQRLEVFGSKGMIKVENEKPCSSLESYTGNTGTHFNPIYYSFPSRFMLAYRYEMEHFLDVVQDNCEMDVKEFQTLAVSRIAAAAEESARTGNTVRLDWTHHNIPANYS